MTDDLFVLTQHTFIDGLEQHKQHGELYHHANAFASLTVNAVMNDNMEGARVWAGLAQYANLAAERIR